MSINLKQSHTGVTYHIPGFLEHVKIRPGHAPVKLSTLKVGECVDEKEGLIDPLCLDLDVGPIRAEGDQTRNPGVLKSWDDGEEDNTSIRYFSRLTPDGTEIERSPTCL